MNCIVCRGITTNEHESIFDTRFGVPGSFTIVRCHKCGLLQTTRRPSFGELKALYEQQYNFASEGDTVYTRIRDRILSSPLYRIWLAVDGDISFHAVNGSGRLLDIGCNEGRGLLFYRKNGFYPEGLEPNQVAAKAARDKEFTVHTELVEEFSPETPYDIVVLANVLEHSLDPREMLTHVRRLLKPGGEVWISCPNCRSWLRFIFGRYWINWHVPFHIVHFSAKTLAELLVASGLDPIRIRSQTPAFWVALSICACLFARRDRPTKQLRSPLIVGSLVLVARALLFPLLWLADYLGHGDCLVFMAKKH